MCDKQPLNILFTGFDRSYIRNISLKRYMKDDPIRTKAIDSGTYIITTTVNVQPGKADTVAFSNYTLSTGAAFSVQYGYDYVLTITSVNHSYLIQNIYEGDNRYQKVKCSDNNTKCVNKIKTYSIDGFWIDSDVMYIRK